MKLHRARDFAAGVLVATLAMGVAVPAGAAALTGKKIDVLQGIEIFVDGVRLDPKDANGKSVETFVYNGTTYIPLRAVSQALGKAVNYDGNTKRAYIGSSPMTTGSYRMEDVCKPYQKSGYVQMLTASQTVKMGGNEYGNGLSVYAYGGSDQYALFNLNGAYNSLTLDLGHIDGGGSSNTEVVFYVDDVRVASYTVEPEALPRKITVPLNHGLQMKIETKGAWLTTVGLGNMMFQ
ncbi:stalk domain-containing protein [Pseudoflavonifractor sp. MSJ-37]|uniref:stalk domain-containing protein n=1 Tax=Pseudoflavonifractor sp. MSJ-37 TaxID=2841531 RepID=UPI0020A09386|nr:stalk domain-containing protein [Pseudoflavonifractor sp. MSJ-37]